jgi:uncharacterized protein (TIGR03435 family)
VTRTYRKNAGQSGRRRNRVTRVLTTISRRFIAAAALFALAGSMTTSAQTAPITSPPAGSDGMDRESFEVTSIRSLDPRNLPGGLQTIVPCSGLLEPSAGRLTITAATVYRLIAAAYGMSCGAANNLELISGGPDWLKKAAFNIQATLPRGTPLYTIRQLQDGEAPKIQAMLRNLLADRFQLVLHRTAKDTPIFNLYFVKEGRVKLSADQTKPGEAPNPLASPLQLGNDPAAGLVRVRGDAIPIKALTMAGQVREGRLVIDKTGLTGLYDVQPSVIDVGTAVFQSGFSAWPQMMSYLGFKLESTHGAVDSIVIDRLETPTEN